MLINHHIKELNPLFNFLNQNVRLYSTFFSPYSMKTPGVTCGVSYGVLDIPVPQIVLYEPCINPFISKGVAAGMSQHMRMWRYR